MNYGRIPLFPPGCGNSSLRMPLFGDCPCRRDAGECQRVRICNPVCPDEVAEVELCVDCDGNLSICVHRPPKPCLPKRRGHDCSCPPWYK